MSTESIEKAVDSYFANMGAMNPEEWVKNFAEDALTYDPVGKPPSKVHEDYQKFFQMLSMIFAQLEVTTNNIFIVEKSAAVKWTMRGTSQKGKQGVAEGITVFEMNEDGKIQQVFAYWDDAAMMAQIRS